MSLTVPVWRSGVERIERKRERKKERYTEKKSRDFCGFRPVGAVAARLAVFTRKEDAGNVADGCYDVGNNDDLAGSRLRIRNPLGLRREKNTRALKCHVAIDVSSVAATVAPTGAVVLLAAACVAIVNQVLSSIRCSRGEPLSTGADGCVSSHCRRETATSDRKPVGFERTPRGEDSERRNRAVSLRNAASVSE